MLTVFNDQNRGMQAGGTWRRLIRPRRALRRRPQADYYAATVAVDVLSFLYVAVNYQVTQLAGRPAQTQARLTARPQPQSAPARLSAACVRGAQAHPHLCARAGASDLPRAPGHARCERASVSTLWQCVSPVPLREAPSLGESPAQAVVARARTLADLTLLCIIEGGAQFVRCFNSITVCTAGGGRERAHAGGHQRRARGARGLPARAHRALPAHGPRPPLLLARALRGQGARAPPAPHHRAAGFYEHVFYR